MKRFTSHVGRRMMRKQQEDAAAISKRSKWLLAALTGLTMITFQTGAADLFFSQLRLQLQAILNQPASLVPNAIASVEQPLPISNLPMAQPVETVLPVQVSPKPVPIKKDRAVVRFVGEALCGSEPCAGAPVHVEVFTSQWRAQRVVTTSTTGHFQTTVSIKLGENRAMRWKLMTYTPTYEKAEVASPRILIPSTGKLTVQQTLNCRSLVD